MKHIFDVDIAQRYGVNAAVLLENISYWIKQNEANETNFFDGTFWTFNSRRAYKELFPYMSERQIDTAFRKLIDDGLLITGNYNKLAYDRTLWYALTQKGKCILHFDGMDSYEMGNGNPQNVTPIPYINPDVNAVVTTDKSICPAVIDYLNEKAGTKYQSKSDTTQRLIKAKQNKGFTLDDFKTVIDKKCAEWLDDDKMVKYLRPSTLFGPRFEEYLNERTGRRKAPKNNGLGGDLTDLDDIF